MIRNSLDSYCQSNQFLVVVKSCDLYTETLGSVKLAYVALAAEADADADTAAV